MSTFESRNPARPAEVIGTFPDSDPSAVDDAVEAARRAQAEWVRLPVPARAELIAGVGEVLTQRKAELANLISREAGKILVEAGGDVQEAIDMAWYIAGQGRQAWGETVPCEMAHKMAWTTRSPVGIAGLITPWNFPVAIPSWKIFPAILGGNAVVIKPSEHAPACCDAFVDACTAAGIPSGLINVVHGHGTVGAAVATHPGIRAVSFTGSVPTGRKVASAANESGPRLVSLELGGKNAMIVMPDADLDLVVDGALFGAFGTAGQRCTSTSRLILHSSVAEEVTERLSERAAGLHIGDPTETATDVGPVIDIAALERISRMVAEAIEDGGSIVTGGEAVTVDGCDGGTFFAPTIVSGVRPDHRLAREEVFGPVLAVIEIGSFDEAIDVVNQSEYGLSAAIYTRDINQALQAVDCIDTGIVYVNAPTIGAEIQLPFGGTKHTGNGYREAGRRGLEQFTETKTVYVDYSGRLQRAQIDNRPPMAVDG